jgi:hypothetical protein
MTRTAAEQDLDVFVSMINQNCAAKLAELDREAFVAKCLAPDDAVAKSIADRRRRLIDLPSTIKPGPRVELAAQWPADFPPLSWAFVRSTSGNFESRHLLLEEGQRARKHAFGRPGRLAANRFDADLRRVPPEVVPSHVVPTRRFGNDLVGRAYLRRRAPDQPDMLGGLGSLEHELEVMAARHQDLGAILSVIP